ncbi:MAG: hypothetical protein IT380_10780 [Myxococcales bacterium]|nr:hypothetical protein [Myxococcales bacterium]
MAIFRKLDPPPRPTVTAPRPPPKPAAPAPEVKKPEVGAAVKAAVNVATGRTSSFEAFKPPPVNLERPTIPVPSEGRHGQGGTADDSLGEGDASAGRNRGTADDSIGVGDESAGRNRGTADDSIGVGDPTEGRNRGTADDSIGTGDVAEGRNRGTADDSIGGGGPVEGRGGLDDIGIGESADPRLLPGGDRLGLPEETQAKMDGLLTPVDSRKAVEAGFVFEQPAFRELSVADREKIVDVMAAGGDRACRAMAEIFKQSDGAMLNRVAKDGTRLIDSLDKLASTETGRQVLADCMYDIVVPGRIWQGQAPTCTVSSMQYELASQQPAEYARLLAGLVVDGSVTMRGGGTLQISANASIFFSGYNHDRRSSTEAIFQSAAMEFANGGDSYSLSAQESHGADGRQYRGLFPDQIRTMVGELFGVEYETREIGSDAEATAELNEIMSRERPSRPVLFDIDMGDFNHNVSLDRISGDRVYYRDPYTGRETSMSKEEFRQRLVAVHYAPPPEIPEFATGKYGRRMLL